MRNLPARSPGTNIAGDIETAADQAITAAGGNAREAVKAQIVANGFDYPLHQTGAE
jgi:hypothetical protein